MTKRILSFVIVLSLVLSASAFNVMATEEISVADYRFDHLVNMGVIPADADPDYIVTRAELVTYLSAMYDGSYNSSDNTISLNFSDVQMSEDYYDALVDCVCLEIINGYTDGTFRPAKAVTINEVLKVAVTMAGYNTAASYKGGWPLGYVTVAKEIGLLKSFSADSYNDNITTIQLAKILYNLLLCKMNDLNIVEEDVYYYTPSNETFAFRNRNLVHVSGVVNGNEYTNFSKTHSTVPYGKISVNDTLLVISGEADKETVGHMCDVFYDAESEKIVSIVVNNEKDETLTLTSCDIESINNGTVNFYDENGKEKKVRIPSDIINIYNGKFVMSCNYSSIFPFKDATLTLIDNDGDGSYEVLIAEEFETAVVNRRNADYTVSDKLDSQKKLNLDDDSYEQFKIINEDNEIMDFSEISENDIISVVENTNYLKAYVARNKISGILTGTDERNTHSTIVIAEEGDFFIAKSYIPYFDSSLIGKNVTLYFNALGHVAFITVNSSDEYSVGYLIKAGLKSENVEKNLYIKLLTSDNKIETYSVREKFKLDEVYTEVSSLNALPEVLAKEQPVRFKIAEDCITDIDTPAAYYSGVEDGFFLGAYLPTNGSAMKKNIFTTQTSSFNGVIEVGDKTYTFSVPQNKNGATDEDYFVYTGGFVGSGVYGNTSAYYFSRENQVADIVVIDNPFSITYDSSHGVVSKMTRTLNAEGESVYKVVYNDGRGENFFYESITNPRGIGVGDIVKIVTDADSNVMSLNLLYDRSARPGYVVAPNTHYSDSFVQFYGYVGLIRDGKVRRSDTADVQNDTNIFSQYMFDLAKFRIVIIEERNGSYNISIGSAADVNAGEYFIATLRGGNPQIFFIYK